MKARIDATTANELSAPEISDLRPCILIVDDEGQNRELLEVMLAPEGYRLVTAENGEEALAMVARQPPDLILLDVMMPGLDGHQVASRIKGSLATSSIPVIMVSALDDRDSRLRGLSGGAEDYLTKPVDRAELCVRVRNLLRLKARADLHEKNSQALRDANDALQRVNARLGGALEEPSTSATPLPGGSLSIPPRDEPTGTATSSGTLFVELSGGARVPVTGAVRRLEPPERGIATLQICTSCKRCYDNTTATCPADGSTLDSRRSIPYLLLGRYRLLQVLGQGGMGVVIAAHDERLGREVAVKLVRSEEFNNTGLKERFEREARAVARIQHPGVVEIHDSGELDDGTAFLVMERLVGWDLRQHLKTYGRGKPAQVARLVRQGCAALRAAHRVGVIHRDVKPENVFLVDDPSGFRVKLLDFGIAKSMALESDLTQKGMVLGTPLYMAPEQVRGENVDGRSDLYAFAAVVYEALTGTRAVEGADVASVMDNVLTAVPLPVSSALPGIPREVDEAFASALAKDPACRLDDIEQWGSSFTEALEKFPGDANTVGWTVAGDEAVKKA